jgi:diguanylate cyclase (GGDEF)-like protein
MSRAQTVVFALLVVNFLLGCLCLAVARGARPTSALKWWGWGSLIFAAGLSVAMFRLAPEAMALTLSNLLIAWSPIIAVEGVLVNTDFHLNRRWVYGALATVLAILIYANHIGNLGAASQSLINLIAPSTVAIITFAIAAYCLVRTPRPAAPAAVLFLAGSLLFGAALSTLRIAFASNTASLASDADGVDQVISLFVVGQIVVAVASTMAMLWIELRRIEVILARFDFTDALTELPNRSAIMRQFHEEESRAVRHGSHFALLILDVDNLRQVNDRHGHAIGDAVLRHVADSLARTRRAGDALGRVGGEEFVMLLNGPRTSAESAAERLRGQVQESAFDCRGVKMPIRVSGGLAMFPDDGVDWDQLFAVADKRVRVSKQNGRNRVTSS